MEAKHGLEGEAGRSDGLEAGKAKQGILWRR